VVALAADREPHDVEDLSWLLPGVADATAVEADGISPD